MARSLIIRTKTRYRRYRLSDTARPITLVDNHLYRTDERYFKRSTTDDDELLLYDIDGIQPPSASEVVDPNVTMAYSDIAKGAGKHGASTISKLANIPSKFILYGVIVAAVLITVLTGGIHRWGSGSAYRHGSETMDSCSS